MKIERRTKYATLSLVALLTISLAYAEPLYISDKLVVNVYAEANQDSSKVDTLDSGDAVEAIEKVDVYTHVRLANNLEGWVKSSYLTAQVPAIVRLKELEKEHGTAAPAATTQLTNELKQSKELNAALQTELAAVKQAVAQTAPATSIAAITVPQTPLEAKSTTSNSDSSNWHPISWGAGFVLVGGLLGFLLGYQTLARRIRRKYGSVRIY